MLLTIKARVEIAEKDFDRAIRTIETGLAFSRHIAEGPFLINGLVALAGARLMLDACEELIAQPGAPTCTGRSPRCRGRWWTSAARWKPNASFSRT